MPQTLTPNTSSSPTTYGSRAGIEGIYGTSNVAIYADLNSNQDAGEIAAQIDRARLYAYQWINSYLNGAKLTNPATVSSFADFGLLDDIEDERAGAWLYFNRGSMDAGKDADGQMQWHYDHAEKELLRLIGNQLNTDSDGGTAGPGTFTFVPIATETCACDENGWC